MNYRRWDGGNVTLHRGRTGRETGAVRRPLILFLWFQTPSGTRIKSMWLPCTDPAMQGSPPLWNMHSCQACGHSGVHIMCASMWNHTPLCANILSESFMHARVYRNINYHWGGLSLHHVVKHWKLDWLVLRSMPCQYNGITHLILLSSICIMHTDTNAHTCTHAPYSSNCHPGPIFYHPLVCVCQIFAAQSASCAGHWPFFQLRLRRPIACRQNKKTR